MKLSVIPLRKSVRRYSDKAVEKATIDQLVAFSRETPSLGNEQIKHDFIFAQNRDWIEQLLHSYMLSYGKLIAAPCLLLPFYDDHTDVEYEFGFQVEHIVLKATELELGTCWINVDSDQIKKVLHEATSDEYEFKDIFVTPFNKQFEINLTNKQIHNAILIGYPSTKRMDRVINNAIRMECKANARKPVESIIVNSKNKPLSSVLQKILEHAILAPSSRNRQPWRIRLTDKGFDVGGFDGHRIDLGIFIAHLKIAMQHFGKPFKITRFTENSKDIEWFGSIPLK
ncbi:hypothetical protein JXJ21_05320 [candidate division KSB1 bacterium]|nr:hypothetical protein [candidate division KSB1 bacterium]